MTLKFFKSIISTTGLLLAWSYLGKIKSPSLKFGINCSNLFFDLCFSKIAGLLGFSDLDLNILFKFIGMFAKKIQTFRMFEYF